MCIRDRCWVCLGSGEEMAYLPSKDDWRKKNLGEMYQYNKKLAYMSVPDRSIKLLVDHDIKLTENEWMTIKLHDGLYDQANEPYLKNYMPEQKPRTSMVFIIHQADLMAARIEFEHVWLSKFNEEVLDKPKACLLYTSPSPRDRTRSRMPSSA